MAEQAKRWFFNSSDFTKEEVVNSLFGRRTLQVSDREAYRKAISDFLTRLGPGRIISVQSFRNLAWEGCEVWYWEAGA